ncbi:hypothetical protein EYB25_003299 [Talaromyces marneffei]|uniref:Ubiquitin carboxyl-terminal hydrolase 19 n=1 Tax=Talaromyces marneffei (strain ATCC 18224 / CBS 334.59 / QM 7333) TaxID=441960 RepID=B6Q986_TALMQ|nr:uncharacterized protein EYB26_005776 [Talaromyces marneffei]EEA26040.1 conserved hypothetical protein [Talaromyces marneffei ATCC 18224]KAE8554758.1 hypothetical protein EYB25_003299 [Talaromyces marneffei]QGA18098.1 hypothetical protein EYB26_005776 [Talaromyces marneffei]
MDAQYPFASREDIWRVFEEVKDLYSTQLEHGERIARLERRREDDARLKSVWGPISQFPSTMTGPLTEPSYTPTVDAFKGFDQGHHHSIITNMTLDNEEEPRRGASRANSVRFDESAISGYYGQVNRSTSELPIRTGSGMSSHALTERSLSHRSDGRQSSSGHSHHSARTNSMGIDTARIVGSSGGSPASSIMPPPGLFLLGPVPCIIRCWLTTIFSNDSLLYAAVCSGSCTSSLSRSLIEKLGYVDQIIVEEGLRYIKLPLYLPEASIHQTSSRAGSPTPQLPAVTVRFAVHDLNPDDKSIQIIVGSDVLRSHNADILFSQDKIIMVDDDRNKVSIPLVRPENDAVFKYLNTASNASRETYAKPQQPHGTEIQETVNGRDHGTIERPVSRPQDTSSIASTKVEEPGDHGRESRPTTRDGGQSEPDIQAAREGSAPIDQEAYPGVSTKTEPAGPWGSWRRTDGSAIGMAKSNRGRTMKVLRPSKSISSRVPSTTSNHAQAASNVETVSSPATAPYQGGENNPTAQASGPDLVHPTPSRSASFKSGDGSWSTSGKTRASNPVGGASAFGWLNSS